MNARDGTLKFHWSEYAKFREWFATTKWFDDPVYCEIADAAWQAALSAAAPNNGTYCIHGIKCALCAERETATKEVMPSEGSNGLERSRNSRNSSAVEGEHRASVQTSASAPDVEELAREIEVVDRADGVHGHYCLRRMDSIYAEYWNPNGWSGFGHVFTDKKLADAVAALLRARLGERQLTHCPFCEERLLPSPPREGEGA